MSTIDVVIPVFQEDAIVEAQQLAPRPATLQGKRLMLIANGKPKGRELLTMVADGLRERAGIAEVALHLKPGATHIVDADEVKAIAAAADVVITGLGDCGACSACSLADAIRMEAAGVPATILITDVFNGNCASFAATLGMPGYHTVALPHPVSSKSDAQLAVLAGRVIDQVVAQLTDQAAARQRAA